MLKGRARYSSENVWLIIYDLCCTPHGVDATHVLDVAAVIDALKFKGTL